MICIYHAKCADGFAAAYLMWVATGGQGVDYLAAKYGDAPPDVTGKDVIIADFSYSREQLIAMKASAMSLIVLDHHVSAQKALEGLNFCTFDMSKSGAMLMYDYLMQKVGLIVNQWQWLVRYVQDRDLWQWKLPQSKEVSAAIASYPFDFEIWDSFSLEQLKREGEAISRYQSQLVQRACDLAQELPDGRKIVNSCLLQSEIGDRLSGSCHYVDIWYRGADDRIYHSLRSGPNGADVSAIAVGFGGGGHKHAAGFVSCQNF